jgi:prepilin-type N-terminal cleavage/methylation domain-containing protein
MRVMTFSATPELIGALGSSSMRRRQAFTLVELLIVIGIIALLVAILLPTVAQVRQSSKRVACASNLRQIGVALIQYYHDCNHRLPARWNGLDLANPHVLRYHDGPEDVSDVMERYAGSRDVFYCPGNSQNRTAAEWWPYKTRTIAVTYQFPFWVSEYGWWFKRPDYNRLPANCLLAADCLGTGDGAATIVMYNHELDTSGQPKGMNLLLGDGHVQWQGNGDGFLLYNMSAGQVFWHYAKY